MRKIVYHLRFLIKNKYPNLQYNSFVKKNKEGWGGLTRKYGYLLITKMRAVPLRRILQPIVFIAITYFL